jgi:NADH-quinone oxidoreductase subunit J
VISPVAVAVLGVPLVIAAILAAASRNLVRAVLWLGIVLALTAVLFVMLGAAFLATIQVLLYIGGVVTLMIFGVMLTNRAGGIEVPRQTRRKLPAAAVSIALFAALAAAILRGGADRLPAPATDAVAPSVGDLAATLLGKDLLAFEALSLLLLAAMIGAIVLARPRDAGDERAAR